MYNIIRLEKRCWCVDSNTFIVDGLCVYLFVSDSDKLYVWGNGNSGQ